MALTLHIRRNLSEATFSKSLAMNGVPANLPLSTVGRVFWRFEDEPTMVPTFLGETKVGTELVIPFDLKGRDIRLFLIGVSDSGTESAIEKQEGEQYLLVAPATPEEEAAAAAFSSIFDFYDDAPTTGTAYQDLYSGTIPAATFAANGDKVKFEGDGTTAANANSKILGIEIDGVGTAEANDGYDNKKWTVDGLLMRSGATALKYSVEIIIAGEAAFADAGELAGLNFANDIALDLRGRSPNLAGDLTAYKFAAWKIPAAFVEVAPDNAITLNGAYLQLNSDYLVFNPSALPDNALTLNGDYLQLNGDYLVFNP